MQFDTKFNPYLSQIVKPSKENLFTAISEGVSDFGKAQDARMIQEIKMDEIQKKRRDDKKIALLQGYTGTRGAFGREHGAFETAEGALAAEKMFRDRALLRLDEKKMQKRHTKNTGRTSKSSISNPIVANRFNPSAFAMPQADRPSPNSQSGVASPKTVTVYKDGKPITYTVRG